MKNLSKILPYAVFVLGFALGYATKNYFDTTQEIDEQVVCSHTTNDSDITALELSMDNGGIIPRATARTLFLAYEAKEAARIQERLLNAECLNETRNAEELQDNSAFHFKLDNLRHYLCYVVDKAALQNITEVEKLGIRIYFGAENEPTGPKTKIFLVPTLFDGTEYENINGIKALNYGNSGRPPVPYTGL